MTAPAVTAAAGVVKIDRRARLQRPLGLSDMVKTVAKPRLGPVRTGPHLVWLGVCVGGVVFCLAGILWGWGSSPGHTPASSP